MEQVLKILIFFRVLANLVVLSYKKLSYKKSVCVQIGLEWGNPMKTDEDHAINSVLYWA